MRFPDAGNDPEANALLERSLDAAWDRAVLSIPTLALLGRDGGQTRAILAQGVREGINLGLRDPTELASFALRAFPSFRLQSA